MLATLFSETGSVSGLEFAEQARLDSRQTQGSALSQSSQFWGYRHASLRLALLFLTGIRDSNSGPHIFKATGLPMEPSPQPAFSNWDLSRFVIPGDHGAI